jgi:hypothetical protein
VHVNGRFHEGFLGARDTFAVPEHDRLRGKQPNRPGPGMILIGVLLV